MSTPVQAAFQASRKHRDIGYIFPVFVRTSFFVLGAPGPADRIEPLLGPSPRPNRLCVTGSESEAALARAGVHPLMRMTGREILKAYGARYDVVVVYDDGGDLLTIEQMQWFLESSP